MSVEDLARQIAFLVEIDRLKGVLRKTMLVDESRHENSAEHSWHLALAAVLLAGYAPPGADVARVVRMVLLHDVVEIDAGDAFAFDAAANEGREQRERRAADRIFGLLPAGQDAELRGLWEEFERGETPDARFAVALDRLQPLLVNHHANGGSWARHGVTRAQVLGRMAPIEGALPGVWPRVMEIIEENCARGTIRME